MSRLPGGNEAAIGDYNGHLTEDIGDLWGNNGIQLDYASNRTNYVSAEAGLERQRHPSSQVHSRDSAGSVILPAQDGEFILLLLTITGQAQDIPNLVLTQFGNGETLTVTSPFDGQINNFSATPTGSSNLHCGLLPSCSYTTVTKESILMYVTVVFSDASRPITRTLSTSATPSSSSSSSDSQIQTLPSSSLNPITITVSASAPTGSPYSTSSSRLTSGAKAGIGIGAALGTIAILAFILWWWRSSKRTSARLAALERSVIQHEPSSAEKGVRNSHEPHELGGKFLHEMSGEHHHEMLAANPAWEVPGSSTPVLAGQKKHT
ncbi:MAG: hypothetical protein Q9226_006735 [Calogaya cf. arnoldii]